MIFFDFLRDPNGAEHFPKDPHCSGCDYLQNRLCGCGGLIHYWYLDSTHEGDFLGSECEKCGKLDELEPAMFDGSEVDYSEET